MSNDNRESPADLATHSSEGFSAASARPTSGLESIVLALQALQKGQSQKVDDEEPTTALPSANPSSLPPMPHGMNAARRVVSTDTIGENDHESTSPQVKEEETFSSSAKAADTTPCSAPVETSPRPADPSSPSPSPPPSESAESALDDIPTTTDESSKAADFSRILADPETWLLQTENLFAKLPPVDRSSDNDIVVQPNDVLCGRGGETNHHPGNIKYRSLVKAYQKLYLLAKRRDKPKIAQCIVVSVRGVNGRFLKRTKNATKGNVWVDVGNVKAREKTSQALREGAPNLRENVSPPVTSSSINDSSAANGGQVLVPDQTKNIAVPPTATTTLPTNTPLEAMMGWRMQTANFNSTDGTGNANGSSSSVPPVSSSPSLTGSDAETDALTAQVFSKAASQLMAHPAFHQLDPARQQEAILFELNNAKAAVESAKRSSTTMGTTPSANVHEQGRTSPMSPTTSMNQQPQSHQNHQPYPAQENPYYQHYYQQMHGGYWQDASASNPKNSSGMDAKTDPAVSLKIAAAQADKNVDLQTMYHELLVAKAAAAAGNNSSLVSAKNNDEESIPVDAASDLLRRKMKKRPAPCSSSGDLSTSSLPARSPTVVSDTGSDTSSSSSSSSCASSVANNIESLSASVQVKSEKTEAVSSVSRGGSRLKRLKLRMKDDFN